MMLILLLVIPLLSGLSILFLGKHSLFIAKALHYFGLSLLLITLAFISQKFSQAQPSFVVEYSIPWIKALNINFHLGLDSFSFLLVLLTTLLGFLATYIFADSPRYLAALSWTIAGSLGIFLALDLFLFFVFWEAALLPFYFLLIATHDGKRVKTAFKFIIYTQASGLILLLSIIGLIMANYSATNILTFNYYELLKIDRPPLVEQMLFFGFMLAFLIKLPAMPFHGWMPAVFKDAPVFIILVGLLVKTAVFGLARFSWPLFPNASVDFSFLMMVIGAFSLIIAAFKALGQSDPKMIMGYSVVSHAGLLLMGIFSGHQASYVGVFFLMITQAFSTGSIMVMLDHLYQKNGAIDLNVSTGLWQIKPSFCALLLVFILAGIGMPCFGNFVGEWIILQSIFGHTPWLILVASFGLIQGAVYSLVLFQRLSGGSPAILPKNLSFRRADIAIACGVMGILLVLGFYPNIILSVMNENSWVTSEKPLTYFGP